MRRILLPALLVPIVACAPKSEAVYLGSPAEVLEVAPVETPISRLDHDARVTEVSDSLQRLRVLGLVRVGELLVDAPAASGNCYGPCEEDAVDQAWMVEHAVQAERLKVLVDVAEEVSDQSNGQADEGEVALALEALAGLGIVEIEGVQTGNCYGPCPDEPERMGTLQAWADAVNGRL